MSGGDLGGTSVTRGHTTLLPQTPFPQIRVIHGFLSNEKLSSQTPSQGTASI